MATTSPRIIGPQEGPQTAFLSNPADIIIYGGAAGGGKSYGLLLDPLRYIDVEGFGAVIFRRTTPQIRNEGGLWDVSRTIYPLVGGDPREHELYWKFPRLQPANENEPARVFETAISFAHLQHDTSVLDHQGAQYPYIGYDELTHFSEYQFWYLLSRNRSTCGVRPCVRATCNPDADSWVAKLIAWWIDQETGYPIPERSGVIRWFARIKGELIWGDSREELKARFPRSRPKSLTFIGAKLEDNQVLMQADPDYEGNLEALGELELERLRHGNWKIKAAGKLFKREWFEFVSALPASVTRWARGWDLAATEAEQGKDPDYTAGVRFGRCTSTGLFYITNAVRGQLSHLKAQERITNTASQDPIGTVQRLPIDPGAGGKAWTGGLVLALAGHHVKTAPPTGKKEARAAPLATQAEAGNVKILRTGDPLKDTWIEPFLDELCNFPTATGHDDQVDAAADAFNELALGPGPAEITNLRM